MAESEIFVAMKALEVQIDNYYASLHQSLQQFTTSFESRFEEFSLKIHQSSGISPVNFRNQHYTSSLVEVFTDAAKVSPIPHSIPGRLRLNSPLQTIIDCPKNSFQQQLASKAKLEGKKHGEFNGNNLVTGKKEFSASVVNGNDPDTGHIVPTLKGGQKLYEH